MNENNDIVKQLEKWFSGAKRIVVAGIGNEIRKDDFVGVKIVRELAKKLDSRNIFLVECETVPESYISQIAKFNPSHVLLIDAGMLGLEPGQARLVDVRRLSMYPAISTHALPLRIFCKLVEEMTKAKIALLAIQPKDVDFGEGLSPKLEKTAKQITKILLKILCGK